jgi:hypothetical protein
MTTPADPPRPEPADAPAPPPGWEQQQPQGWGPPPAWQQPGQWSGAPAPSGGPTSSEDTTWAVLVHLSIFVLSLLGPLVIYLVKKDSSPFVRQHAAEALNFHITLLIAGIVSTVLVLVLIGILLLLALLVVGAVFAIIAAIAASKGQPYRYPMTLRLVS